MLVPARPYIFKHATLQVDGNDYAPAASTIALVPSTTQSTVEWQGLTPDSTFTDTTTPKTSWALNVTAAQDHAADSFQSYCFDNAGESKVVTIQPQAGSGEPQYTVTVTIVPMQIGGDVDTVQTATASMPVTGQPVKGAAA